MDDILVATGWLQDNLAKPRLVILDCSWHLPEAKRDARAEFEAAHVPGARFIDLNDISDATSPYVNMMPPAGQMTAALQALGVDGDSEIVVYDGSYVSARVWWMLRSVGHAHVRILDGGLRKWLAEGRPLEQGRPAAPRKGSFIAAANAAVAGWPEVLAACRSGSAAIVDARTAERFTGAMPSGYPGVPGGHIPASINLPWSRFYQKDFSFVGPDAARRLFEEARVDLSRPIIATCGSGVTAAILVMMLQRIGQTNVQLYDGSWHEWGQRPDLPKATG